jgi:hypothetical protein
MRAGAAASPASPQTGPLHPPDMAAAAASSLFVRPVVSATSKFTTARTAAGRLAPTLVLDLDDTVLYRSRGVLDALLIYGLPASWAARAVGVPYPGALEAVHDLSAHFRIVRTMADQAAWRQAAVLRTRSADMSVWASMTRSRGIHSRARLLSILLPLSAPSLFLRWRSRHGGRAARRTRASGCARTASPSCP